MVFVVFRGDSITVLRFVVSKSKTCAAVHETATGHRSYQQVCIHYGLIREKWSQKLSSSFISARSFVKDVNLLSGVSEG